MSTHTSNPHPTPTAPSTPSSLLQTILLIFALILIVTWVKSCYKDHKQKAKEEKAKAAAYAATHPPAPVIVQEQQHIPVPTFHPFGPDGCYETNLGYEARWSPKDKAMRVYDPGGGSHVEALGKKSPISAFGPGTWRFCKEDPAATGVVIWE